MLLVEKPAHTHLLIFLGSTLGNLDEQACETSHTQIQQALQPGEFFLCYQA